MRKLWKQILICSAISLSVYSFYLLKDHHDLNRGLIRLHVVANSDAQFDQDVKLQVRDSILNSIQQDLANVTDLRQAKSYLEENLPKLQEIANQTLARLGVTDTAVVTLCKEAFDIRRYDTFSLPSGVYDSLRVVIGDGEGHNWWCVAFPALCVPATSDAFEDAAVGAGFSQSLSDALTQEDNEYEIRFLLLDMIGQLENHFFHAEKNHG